MHRMPDWIDENYRMLMLIAMGIELLLLVVLVVVEVIK